MGLFSDNREEAARQIDAMEREVRRVIVGQRRMLERLTCCLLAGGHVLFEGVPGVGKTLTLSTLAKTVGGTFARIQFTADLLPSDIVGTRVYRASREEFDIEPGPIFANFVLADEINRSPAKVQSALLEVMAEQQVTLAGRTMPVPEPFMVLATQNPLESEGVFSLPEAQRDRFMMRVIVPLPNAEEERQIMDRVRGKLPKPREVLSLDDLRGLQDAVDDIIIPDLVADYAVRLTTATRDPGSAGLPELQDVIANGASPRATISMDRAARAMALMRGRRAAEPQDVYDIAYDVLNHRLSLSFDALARGTSVDDALRKLLTTVPAPPSW